MGRGMSAKQSTSLHHPLTTPARSSRGIDCTTATFSRPRKCGWIEYLECDGCICPGSPLQQEPDPIRPQREDILGGIVRCIDYIHATCLHRLIGSDRGDILHRRIRDICRVDLFGDIRWDIGSYARRTYCRGP